MIALYSIVLGVIYRLRGGGFFTLTDSIVRSIWGAFLAITFIAINPHYSDAAYSLSFIPLAYASLAFIPHAFAMNMGRGASPQNKWPAWYMPILTQSEWIGIGSWGRTAYDFLSMAGVGFIRGAVVFAPYEVYSLFYLHETAIYSIIRAIAILTIGQPIAYFIGWFIPFSLPSLAKYSTEWCELFNGMVYAVCLYYL